MNRVISTRRMISVFAGLSLTLGVGSASAAVTADGCVKTIIKEAQGFAKKKSTALRKCEDGVLKGKITGPCPDSANATKIADAMAKAEAKIDKKCAGLEGVTSSGECTAAGVPDACCTDVGAGDCFPANIGYGAFCPRV